MAIDRPALLFLTMRNPGYLPILIILSLAIFGEVGTSRDVAGQTSNPGKISDSDLGKVCRATIAATMGRDPQIVRLVRIEDGIAYTLYSRPSDGTVWQNRCRVEDDRVIWSTVDLGGPGSGPGRWRNHRLDDIVYFSLDGARVIIKTVHSDGSGSEKSYRVD